TYREIIIDPPPPDSCPSAERCAADLRPGDVIFTEFNPNPYCQLHDGEYVELYNTTDSTIELKDVTFRQIVGATTRNVKITSSYVLPPRGFVTLVRGSSSCYQRPNRIP